MCYENKIYPKILLMKYLSDKNYRLYGMVKIFIDNTRCMHVCSTLKLSNLHGNLGTKSTPLLMCIGSQLVNSSHELN